MKKLTPYVVKLSRTIERHVIIYAESQIGVADVAQAMCASGKIKIGDDDDYMVEAVTLGEADKDDIEDLDGYTFSFEKAKPEP